MTDSDAVDRIVEQWTVERPDVPTGAMALFGRIRRAARLLDWEFKSFFGRYGLEPHEFDVLATLRRSGAPYELTAGGLLKSAMVTSGAITNRLDRLTAKGLVERLADPADRRSVRVRLTPAGLRLVDEVVARHAANEERLAAVLAPDELAAADAALRRLLLHLGDAD